jgi:phosphonate transport system substrate-binding protein
MKSGTCGKGEENVVITRRKFATTLTGFAASAALAHLEKAWAERAPIRVAVSMDTLAGANVNDARAAYRVWGQEIAKTLALRNAEMLSQVFIPSAELIQMIRSGQVDCFALTALEYASVMNLVDPDCAIIEDYSLDGLDYILLVRNDSAYKRLEDLRGKSLILLHHRDTSMLHIWLSIQLAHAGCPDIDQFFDTSEMHEQVAEVILPVFFRRTQAAGLSRRAFNMAVELNPQLGRELRVISTSPKVIPDGFWFRKDCDPEDRRVFQQSMLRLSTIPAGRQVLALYQSTGFQQRPCSIMNGTVDMIHQYERLHKHGGGGT